MSISLEKLLEHQMGSFYTDADNPDSYEFSDKEPTEQELARLERVIALDKDKRPTSLEGIYLQEINQVDLLTAQEEVALGIEIEIGKKAHRRLATDPTNIKTLQELQEDVYRGNLAARKLVEANLRLVVSIAKKRAGPMSLLDLVQEGNIGLLRAVQKYDYKRGFRFTTLATWWIRQAISRALNEQARTIRLPEHKIDEVSHLFRVVKRLQQELGRDPLIEEIAAEMGTTPKKVENLFRIAATPRSLDETVGEEGKTALEELMPDDKADATESARRREMREDVKKLFVHLNKRERLVLNLRFGISDGISRTLEEVGRELGVTRERVRQIERGALKKLRKATNGQSILDYV